MRTIHRQGVSLLTAVTALAASTLFVAPMAVAVDSATVELSSSSQVPVSGTATVYYDPPGGNYVDIYFPAVNYTSSVGDFSQTPCSNSVIYGFSMTVDGSAATIDNCYFNEYDFGSGSPLNSYELYVEADRSGSVVVLSWNSLLITKTTEGNQDVEISLPTGGPLVVTPTLSGGGSRNSSSSVARIDYLQQVPLPESGNCGAVDDAEFAWDTGLSGGWKPSWAQWANSGRGGPICTRTLVGNGNTWVLG